MKAMILAAGYGTRLRPLTNDCPKALVDLDGHTMLEIVLTRLRIFGIRDVIVNVHHYAQMIIDYLHVHNNFGMNIQVSREEDLLDTGGGLKNAASFFLDPAATPHEPFILHNVDVLSSIDFDRMMRAHLAHHALATLAVQDRETSRYLLFDQRGLLCGRRVCHNTDDVEDMDDVEDAEDELVRSAREVKPLAFSGIHVISPCIFAKMKDEGVFSIIDAYLHLAAWGERIMAFRADEYLWRDLGRPENVLQTAGDLRRGTYHPAG